MSIKENWKDNYLNFTNDESVNVNKAEKKDENEEVKNLINQCDSILERLNRR